MFKSLIASLIIFLTATQITAQNGSLSGKVLLNDSLTTLQGVIVRLLGTELGDASNGNGEFSLRNIPPGSYEVNVNLIGFETLNESIVVSAGSELNLNFYLTESIASCHEVLILSKNPSGIQDIPGSVYYLSPKELQKFSFTDINRALKQVPGVNIQEEDGFGLRPNIGLRGTGVERSSKITIMEDGILMAPAPYSDPSAYYFPTMGRMQAIEISKGSSQIKYGPFTTGGAINLISTAIPEKLSARINLLGGSYSGRNLHAYAGNSHEQIAYLVETFQYGSDGFKNLDGGGNTGFKKEDYIARLRFQTKPDAKVFQSLSFKVGQVNETSHETYLGLTQEDFDKTPFRRYAGSQKDMITTKQNQFSATHFIRVNKKLSLTTTAYYTKFERNWYKLDKVQDTSGTKYSIANILDRPVDHPNAYDVLLGNAQAGSNVLFVRSNNRKYNSRGVQSQAHYEFISGKINHEIEMGLRYHVDEVDRFQWDDQYTMDNGSMELISAGVPGTESNRINSAAALAGWMQYKLKVSNWTFIPGLRYENIELKSEDYGTIDLDRTGENRITSKNRVDVYLPGMGIDYQINKFASLFGGVHKGFSPPGPKDETKPEQSINYEFGARYAKNALSGQVVLFMNDYSNLLGSDLAASGGGGTGDLFNAGKVLTRGVEFAANTDALSYTNSDTWSLPIAIAYTYTEAEFKNSFSSTFADWAAVQQGDEFPYLAKHQLSINAGIEHLNFSFFINCRYMDKMRTTPGAGEIAEAFLLPSYVVLDVAASYKANEKISFFSSITNITNETYLVARRPAGLRPGMPVCLMAGLKAQF
ncbi:MAG: TonB-dependent receptor domain-containing protein [Flavobacteriales bacterium]